MVVGTVSAIIFLRTSPSLPRMLAVVVPRIILLGLTALPIAPPADCAPKMADASTFRRFAVVIWNPPNRMFELMLLPVIKVPRSPTNGAKITYTLPKTFAIPFASTTVCPVPSIIFDIITRPITAIPDGMVIEIDFTKILFTPPSRIQPCFL